MAVFSPYEDLSPVARDNTPIHIPSGIPGEPQTTGTATIGNRVMPFPIQQDTAAEQQGWVKRMNEFDRVKRETAKAEEDAAYLKNLMMNQRTTGSARAVEAAMTFQAMRNYERDYSTAVAAGLSPSQAGVQAMARNPGILRGTGGAAIVKALTPPPTPTVHNLAGVKTPYVQLGNTGRFAPADNSAPLGPASVVTDPDTGNRIGLRIPGGPRTAAFRMDVQPPKPGSLTAVEKERIKDLNRQETDLRKNLPTTPPTAGRFGGQGKVDAYSALTNSIAEVRAQRDRILFGTNAPAGVKLDSSGSGGSPLTLTREVVAEFKKAAGGDMEKAKKLAREAGYSW